jgi:hypothetical protein
MKPYDSVSSLRGANTLLQGQQINGQNTEERTEEQITEERSKERPETRSKEIKGPEQRNQDRFETQLQWVITHCKKKV